MKKTILLFTVFLLSTFVVNAQYFDWVKSIPSMEGAKPSIAVDSLGNLYVTGRTENFDIFVKKLTSNGTLLWEKRIGASDYDEGTSIAVDVDGNIYVAGTFAKTVDFNPTSNSFNLTAIGSKDFFILKLNTEGDFLWVKNIKNGWTGSIFLAPDTKGNIYITGSFEDTIDFDPNENVYNLTSIDFRDAFIQKLDLDGNLIWAKSIGGTDGHDIGVSISVTPLNNVFVLISSGGARGRYGDEYTFTSINKLNSEGYLEWSKNIGERTPGVRADGRSIAVDNLENVYTTGTFYNTIDFDPNEGITDLTATADRYNVFIQKLNTSGQLEWVKKIGGEGLIPTYYKNPYTAVGTVITTDASNNIYTTGSYEGTVDFNPNSDTLYLTALWRDVFIQKLNSKGDFLWAKSIAASNSSDIVVDKFNTIYTVGTFHSTVDFDPTSGTSYLTSTNFKDIFIQKLTTKPKVVTPLGINDSYSNSFKLYPNPTVDFLNVEIISKKKNIKLHLHIVDYTGKIVYQTNFSQAKKTINLSFLTDGIYYIQLTYQTGEKYIKKLIINR